ncbi:L-serine ammonia-lyase, iron-sulfur-dependent subunit beta [Companilactobacillus allii]|uniref:L-serine deaminase n=1 Tax=Companilactobacillus allii TaxID=1847728 RepID=A0A1P8Q1X2_9LACO|nr:L-serine ammonia-lyase, iron-sulfur-dependent subunit beta [Companilactobacillus allii]APX71858.1 L-serine ammonia-lyase, iron-sulfur-dependent, subunit beta [Companilactobacillus allii]USQ68947.1 L-serine ammonia-lyase, iron-sulfur-dependent subunit beta [Companilactobacillus allii]
MADLRFNSVFDIIGPVMIGPSSSHTAGAARIGKVVHDIFGEKPDKITIDLYESFAKTYRGHGTDVAIVGGLLGMHPDDTRLSTSLKLAYEDGIKVAFVPKSDKVSHPNTTKITMIKGDHKLSVTGISIGGGNIQISEINGLKISLSMGVPTYILVQQDVPGVITKVTDIFTKRGINIGTMTVTRESKGKQAITIIEVDDTKDQKEIMEELRSLENMVNVTFFN